MRYRAVLKMAVLVLASGCAERIQQGLDERQANQLVSVLIERGFDARKLAEPGKKPTWAVQVDSSETAGAVRTLAELDLPRKESRGVGEIFGKGSLVPSPIEERALYVQALCGEVERTLETLEGVISARVHLVPAPASRAAQGLVPAKASALLRAKASARARLLDQRDELKALIAGSLEGLSPDLVTVMIDEVKVTPVPAPRTNAPTVRLPWICGVLGAAIGLVALGFFRLGFRKRAVA